MSIITDSSISLKAKGIYLVIEYMVFKDMEISLKTLSDISLDGQTSIRGAINELIDKKYLERETLKNGNLIKGYKYKIIK